VWRQLGDILFIDSLQLLVSLSDKMWKTVILTHSQVDHSVPALLADVYKRDHTRPATRWSQGGGESSLKLFLLHGFKNLGPSQKTLRPTWCPRLVTGLAHTDTNNPIDFV